MTSNTEFYLPFGGSALTRWIVVIDFIKCLFSASSQTLTQLQGSSGRCIDLMDMVCFMDFYSKFISKGGADHLDQLLKNSDSRTHIPVVQNWDFCGCTGHELKNGRR